MLNKKIGLMALLASFATSAVMAGNFTSYSVGDVLLCFRKSGGANDLVVDAGPVATLTNLTANTRYPITTFTGSQLAVVGTNSVTWSAFTYFDQSVTPASAYDTIFVSRARTSINTQSTPWTILGTPGQQNDGSTPNILVEGDMQSVLAGAQQYNSTSYNAKTTATAVIEPENQSLYANGIDYADVINQPMTQSGNFNGDFNGNVENTTSSTFVTGNTVARSDFYKLPYSGKVAYLGYFELSTNGSVTYVAYPSVAVAVPVIKSIGRTNNITSVSFTTSASGTYTLRGVSGSALLSTARLTWPAITSVAGDGAVHILTDTTTSTSKFYIITAQ